MPNDIFSDEALKSAVKKLPDLPPEQVNVGVVAKDGDIGVEVEGNKQLGNGFFVEGDASWWKTKGYQVAGWFGWKGKDAK